MNKRPPSVSSVCRAFGAIVILLLSLAGCGVETPPASEAEPVESEPVGEPEETTGATRTPESRVESREVEEMGEESERRMSLRDAVGQMFVVSVGGTEPDYYIQKMVRERNIGGVILFGYNMASEEQTKSFVTRLQELSLETEPAIPLFVAVDHEGGEVQHAPWVTPQPSAAEVGAGGDPEAARLISNSVGRELLRAGVNTDLAPVVDTGSGAAIGSRSYGDDPDLVAEMGAAAVEGFEEAGVVSAAKHFLPVQNPVTV